MPRIHPRQVPVNQWRIELHARLWKAFDQLNMGYVQMFLAITSYQADLVRGATENLTAGKMGIPVTPQAELDGVIAVGTAVQDVKAIYPPCTGFELLLLLTEFQQKVAAYLLRNERGEE